MSLLSLKVFSSRSSSRPNAHITFLMDNLFAIAFGLGLRFVVDSVSHHDFKLSGTLVGLWEGVVTLHFLKKMPKSFDPYIAYVVRLFVDFLVTESLIRLVLVVVWTGMGMVLADIAPAIWHDVGGHRVWRRFQRDMYYMSRSVPTIPPLFPRARVVRFSPVTEPSEISETLSTLSPTPTSQAPTTRIIPPTPSPPRPIKRPIPGRFPASVVSETDTEATSVVASRPLVTPVSVGTSHVRYTVRPRNTSFDSGAPSVSASVDDSNLSSEVSSVSTETPSLPNQVEEEVEIQLRHLDKGKGKEQPLDGSGSDTPTRRAIVLPPTPSESYHPHFGGDRSSIVPTITAMPSIPDFFESGLGSDWETIHKEEAGLPPTPPGKDFHSKSFESPPVHYIPPPSSVYEPTPRPSNFDRDLWDDVSNAAPSTPQMKTSPKQRNSRLPPTTSMIKLTAEPVLPRILKKRQTEAPPPPRVPQTPVYGDAWDTEKDQLPPQTPSVLARTPMYDHNVELNNEPAVLPAESNVVPPLGQPQEAFEGSAFVRDQQNPADFSLETDDPWVNPDQPAQEQEEQQQQKEEQNPGVPQANQSGPTAPSTPHVSTHMPSTPHQPTLDASSTPQRHSGTITLTPQHRPGTVPATPRHTLKPVPPQPEPVPTTPKKLAKTVPSTPLHKSLTVLKSQTVPSSPQQQPQPIPVAQAKPQTVPQTPQKKTQTIPSTPQQKPQTVPHTPLRPLQPVPPEPTPPTPLQQPKTMLQTSEQRVNTVPPTPQQKLRTTPSTPQHQAKTVSQTPAPQHSPDLFGDFSRPADSKQEGLFDDLAPRGDIFNEGPDLRLQDIGGFQQQSQPEGNLADVQESQPQEGLTDVQQLQPEGREGALVDVGEDDNGVNENGNKTRKGDDNPGDENANGGEGEEQPTEQVQLDPQNNPLSPASSGYSSAAGVPNEIKERNKQAIIIRAQIFEISKRIEELKEEKLKAQGNEELDPQSEESTEKEQEIQKAERSLEKLKKRAEKRYQAALESTGLLTIGKSMNLNFEETSSEVAAARLEDILGLFFTPERKSIRLEMNLPKGGPGKTAVKAAIQRVLSEYGIKSISKHTGVSVTALAKTYTDIVTGFRQQHSKQDDS